MGWLRGRGRIAGVLSAIVTVLAVAAAVALLALGRVPALLVVAAAWVAPDYRVSVGDARLQGGTRLDVRHLRVHARATNELVLAAKRLRVAFTPWGVRRSQLGEVHLIGPLFLAPTPPSSVAPASEGAAPIPWTVDRLVVRRGRVWARRLPERPGLAFRFATDLRDLGFAGARGARSHRLRVRDIRATLADGPPNVVLDDLLLTLRPSAVLEERTLDEVRLFGLRVDLPGLPAGAAAGDDAALPEGWRVGRLVTHGARIDVRASAEQPGLALVLDLDLRELGLATPENERLHTVRLRDVRLALADRPPSVVLDAARAEFRIADLLSEQRLARFAIERGTLLVDGALRARLAAGGAGPEGPETRASVGVLEIRQLATRIAELGPEIPDVTLTFATTLRDVPLGPAALARAHDAQRVELADLRLYSPLDPFRPVVHIGSVFVDFTLADVIRQRLAALLLLSPTIYLGEDLIWYMNMASRQTAASTGPPAPPWTVGRVRADLGRIVVTFNGTDRLSLPITFRSQADNVALDELASLHLSAELQVPKQSYTFPGFDLALVDMEGELRFDYPRGAARDNVVNVLNVREMRWRDYRLENAWLSVTFDESGINGRLGGQAYEGYVDGGLSIPFGAAPPWAGWMAGTKLDLAPIAAVIAKGGIEMSGIVDAKGAVDLRQGTRLERAEGELVMTTPGHLRIPDLETLLARLPENTTEVQRDLVKVAVEAFADYAYTSGGGRLDFAGGRGVGRLTLDGPRGARRFALHYYEDLPLLAEVGR
jgi:hypothetical protein